MNTTEVQLLAVHRSPVVRLEDICQKYMNLDYRQARDLAATGELGLPTFRLRESRKAPLLVHIRELAKYIDRCSAQPAAA